MREGLGDALPPGGFTREEAIERGRLRGVTVSCIDWDSYGWLGSLDALDGVR